MVEVMAGSTSIPSSKDKSSRKTAQDGSGRKKGKQREEADPGTGPSNSSKTPSLPPQPSQQSPFPVILPPGDDRFDILRYNPANYRKSGPSHTRHDPFEPRSLSNTPTNGTFDTPMRDAENLPDDSEDPPLPPQDPPAPIIVILPAEESSNLHPPGPPKPFEPLKFLSNTPEIVFLITRFLRLDDVVSLYAMSKDFRQMADSRFTGLMQVMARWKAPESAMIFSWAFFKPLCMKDPGFRPHPRIQNECRLVPSFRWLRFVYYREKIVQEIMSRMNDEGVRIPKAGSRMVKKIWLLMDIPDNARRIALMQSRWTDQDLLFAQMFFIKLDMRFCDPVDGKGQNKVRKMMMAQKSMTVLNDVLARRALLTQLDCVKMYVRWKWVPEPAHRQYPIFGIPADEVGTLQYEGWGTRRPRKLIPIESLVVKEACRRELGLENDLVDILQWGYVNPNTGDDYVRQKVPKRPWRLEDEYSDDEEEDNNFEKYLLVEHKPCGPQREYLTVDQI
jgi:hypothetical protein